MKVELSNLMAVSERETNFNSICEFHVSLVYSMVILLRYLGVYINDIHMENKDRGKEKLSVCILAISEHLQLKSVSNVTEDLVKTANNDFPSEYKSCFNSVLTL